MRAGKARDSAAAVTAPAHMGPRFSRAQRAKIISSHGRKEKPARIS
jgi:hypothetical protein